MSDISKHTDPLVSAIYEQYEKRNASEQARTYLGGSVIGRECKRALWYSFHWASQESFDGRLLRLFQTGHLSEPRFIQDLRAVGATVYDVDPASGKQFSFSALGGHMRGSMDGCAKNVPGAGKQWMVLEFKTHNAKSFALLKKDGVQKAKPEHWIQMNTYMGWSGMDRALYLAVNKDTDDLHSERLAFDLVLFEQTIAKAESIIFAQTPPPKLRDDPKYFLCNWCSHNTVCHGHRVPAVSCRTCVHATPEREGDGRWSCALAGGDSTIPVQHQRTGCPQHLPLPFLLTYADPVDAGTGWIEFKRKDTGLEFVVAAPGTTHPYPHFPIYSTQEISAAHDHKAIANPEIEKFRTQFPGSTITG